MLRKITSILVLILCISSGCKETGKQPISEINLDNFYITALATGDSLIYAAGNFFEKDNGKRIISSGGLYVISYHDPGKPRILGSCTVPWKTNDIAVKDTIAYISESSRTAYSSAGEVYDIGGGLCLVSIADPSAPRELTIYWTIGEAGGLELQFPHVFLTEVPSEFPRPSLTWKPIYTLGAGPPYGGGMRIIYIDNPAKMKESGFYRSLKYPLSQFRIAEDRAYLVSASGELQVIDISVKGNPLLVSTFQTDSVVNGIAIDPPYLYLCTADSILEQLQIADAGKIQKTSRQFFNRPVTKIRIDNKKMLVLFRENDMAIYNVTAAGISKDFRLFGTKKPVVDADISGNFLIAGERERLIIFNMDPE